MTLTMRPHFGPHRRQHELGKSRITELLQCDRVLPFGEVDTVDAVLRRRSRIVHQDIDRSAERCAAGVDRLGYRCRARTRRPARQRHAAHWSRAISSAACRSARVARTMATSQPSRANSSATARPMPRLAPVTRARLPLMPRSTSILLDAGAFHHGGPPIEFRLQHDGKLVGRARRDVPSLRDEILRDIWHAQRPIHIGDAACVRYSGGRPAGPNRPYQVLVSNPG